MKISFARALTVAAAAFSLAGFSGCETTDEVVRAFTGNQQYVNSETVMMGLKEALSVGTQNAVAQTSKPGGYWQDPKLRIQLPRELQKFAEALRGIGMGAQVDELEKKMNEGAELAANTAAPVFIEAIRNMSISDARGILKGSDTAATDFFRNKTYSQLKARYTPVIAKELDQVGAVKQYNELYQKYTQIPLVPHLDVRLDEYVTGKALDGLFSLIAEEEKKIRQDPSARTTDLLKKVFGQ